MYSWRTLSLPRPLQLYHIFSRFLKSCPCPFKNNNKFMYRYLTNVYIVFDSLVLQREITKLLLFKIVPAVYDEICPVMKVNCVY
jgi:hypothetical protein